KAAPCASASNACVCVTARKPSRLSRRICAAKSSGVTLSLCVIGARPGPILPMRWYMRIGSVSCLRRDDRRREAAGNGAARDTTRRRATARRSARRDIDANDGSLLNAMRGVVWIAVAVVAFLVTGSAPAAPERMLPDQQQARNAVKHALASGWIDGTTAARSRAEIDRSARLIRRLPSSRANRIAVALSEVAHLGGRLTRPRALALIGELKANNDFFVRRGPPHDRTDIKDADGIVYRFFAGRCFEFHPLAEFGEL